MEIKLLIADDEKDIRDMLSRHFRYLGYHVLTAAHGKEALDIMACEKVDIVISDIMMPVMDGAELCSHIRRDYPITRIIMITGYVSLDNALSCLRRGADTCIFKPLEDLTELEKAVERSVETLQRWVNILKQLTTMKA